MGDSDDEYDRKRRDKFRGERAEANYRGAERAVRPRDDWQERDAWSRPRPRDYRSGVRDRGYSPSMEPAPKRLRHDYYGDGGFYNHYYHPPPRSTNFFREPPPIASDGQQPPMMSFKAFLSTQDDNISDSEAIEKYNDYKLEFQRQQLNEFFVAHKDDEWFRLKYHPEDSVKRREDQMKALKKRLEVFLSLYNTNKLDGISVDCSQTNNLLKLLDTVVIKLENGTEEDLTLLEQEYSELEKKQEHKYGDDFSEKMSENKESESENDTKTNQDNQKKDTKKEPNSKSDNDNMETSQNENDGEIVEITNNENKPQKESSGDNDQKEKSENVYLNMEINIEKKDEIKGDNDKEKHVETAKRDKTRTRSYSGSSSSSSSSNSSSDSEDEKDDNVTNKEKKNVAAKLEEVEKKEEVEKEIIETVEVDAKPEEKPRSSLHKTTSIFLRNLAPTITRQEIDAMCSRYDGFLRVALAEPQAERRWLRRGWVTFKRDANIKEICWNLNNIRLRDCELGAIVNRDLSRRIRAVNGILAHKQVVRSDIRISAKVVLYLDTKNGLWIDHDDKEKNEKPKQTFGLMSNNPVLHNITDYLIEEASAEEEELLGLEPSSDTVQDATTTVERDDTLISVLDRIILYLRIVHSIDYYNHCDYPNEDEMPNRCGILHARGPPPTVKTDVTQFVGVPIETKMAAFLPDKQNTEENKNDSKLIALSLKDVDTEIDKFVQANTRELAKDKWLCPLSGKKFKGPDFVRKHIFNKHAEKIEEVRKEVEFFNNYLRDPKRPMLVEVPHVTKREEQPGYSHPPPSYQSSYGSYGPPRYYNQGYAPRPRGYAPRARGGGGGDFRPVIHYRDLDAPRELEEF